MAGKPVASCIGPSYHLSDVKAACQSAINCFPRRLDDGRWMMASAPGTVDIATLSGAVRNQHIAGTRWFVVAGSSLLEMATDGTSVSRGTLSTSAGFVGMDHTESQMALVDGANLYILNLDTNVFTQVVSAGWRGSADVRALDGYFVFVAPNSQQYYISAIDDGTNLDALDFNSADGNPDNIVAHIVNHLQLWLMGDQSCEIHVDSGGAAFPFTRYNSYPIDIGIVGPNAKIAAADTIFFVGKTRNGTGVVYVVEGNLPKPISTTAVEESLLSSSDLSGVTMWAYQPKGHEFIGINAPGLSTTWVYDARNQLWHERGEWDAEWLPLRWVSVASVGNRHYAGDSYGAISLLDNSSNQISGRHLVRERTWPHIVSGSLDPVSFYGLELSMKTGETGSGSVTLEISNDGGSTWGPKLMRSLGATGRRMQRVRWLGLGAAINRVFRIRMSENAPFSIYSATVDTE